MEGPVPPCSSLFVLNGSEGDPESRFEVEPGNMTRVATKQRSSSSVPTGEQSDLPVCKGGTCSSSSARHAQLLNKSLQTGLPCEAGE